jgi:hypothetical protein
MKKAQKIAIDLNAEELSLLVEEIPPSQAEKIKGGEDVDTNGDGILDSTMTRKVAESLGYKCIRCCCG